MTGAAQIDYNHYLSAKRLRTSSQSDRTILTESESDRGRVLFSPAFRRLQQKAQVFSMEPNAAVRSRLTHSLEVSQIGRYIADEIGNELLKQRRLDASQQGALVNFVETACLIHDIGNPPFGHFGEAAIQQWFRLHGRRSLLASLDIKEEQQNKEPVIPEDEISDTLADFLEFDGNPQGFRIVSRLQWNNDEFGLNLTTTTLASFLKYLRNPTQKANGVFTKKPGFFVCEKPLVENIWTHFGYDSSQPRRFPLNYIMEAADDIAYCISDLEDSFEKKIIREEITFPEIKSEYEKLKFSKDSPEHDLILNALTRIERRQGNDYTYTDFRTTLNRAIIKYAAKKYISNENEIAEGRLKTLLPEDEPPGAILKVLSEYCRKHVYSHESVQRIELAGYTAIAGLLDHFGCLLRLSSGAFKAALKGLDSDDGKKLLIEPKLLSLFPAKQKLVYLHHLDETHTGIADNLWEWNARSHLVVDFISGMTDDFAMTTYRTLAGMRL